MGVSTDAILAFGFDLGDDLPGKLGEYLASYEDGYFDFEEFIATTCGVGPDEWEKYTAAKTAALENCGAEITTHCSHDYPSYFLHVPGAKQRARRGDPKKVELPQIGAEQIDALRAFCDLNGIDWQEPAWHIFSYWG